MAKIISVVNQKGGTGKSACAANLGVGLALMNKKVLVVDADRSQMCLLDLDSVTAIIVMKH